MDLYIIRHAWAGHFGDPAWPTDAQRPLSDEGRERFAQMVEKLVEDGFAPTLIATSPMVRCVETAEVVARVVGKRAEIVRRDELLPGGDTENLVTWTSRHSREHDEIAWVGHAPDVGQMAAAMMGRGAAWIHFGKGTIAAIRFEDLPDFGRGELRWLVTAKVLGC